MCNDDQEFTTIVGPRGKVEQLIDQFERLTVARRHRLSSPPRLIDLGHLSHRFSESRSPCIAVLDHPQSTGFAVANELQVELLSGNPSQHSHAIPELLCEPGFEVRAASSTSSSLVVGLPGSTVTKWRASVPKVAASQMAKGKRVALLDTGSANSTNKMVDFLADKPHPVTAADDNGHGTSVAEVISTLSPRADIHALRVLGPLTKRGLSHHVLAGLACALWSEQFDIVNASLTTTTLGRCEQSLGNSIDYIVQMCRSSGRQLPLLVAAVGNDGAHPTGPKKSGYPAVVPDAIVAIALESDPSSATGYKRAAYNSTPPQQANEVEAFGGSDVDPVGTVQMPGGPVQDLFGSSFAAAAVTAAHIP